MAGIYGTSKEDKYFENRLLDHLDNEPMIGVTKVEDVQVSMGSEQYSIDATVYVTEEDVNVEIEAAYQWNDGDWSDFKVEVTPEFLKKLRLACWDDAVEQAYKYFQI